MLLLVLSIVLAIVAIYLAVLMFFSFSAKQMRTAIISDLTNFKALAKAYYLTSNVRGGSSHGTYNWDDTDIAAYIGVGYNGATGLETQNATIEVSLGGPNNTEVTFIATPKAELNYKIKLVYNVSNNTTTIEEIP